MFVLPLRLKDKMTHLICVIFLNAGTYEIQEIEVLKKIKEKKLGPFKTFTHVLNIFIFTVPHKHSS